jgi:hypothetical protein
MAQFCLHKAYNSYPKGLFGRVVHWNPDDIIEYYSVDKENPNLQESAFIKGMCTLLNDADDFLRTSMKVRIFFDRLDILGKNLACRFELPCSEIKRRRCMIYLCDMVEHNDVRHCIESVTFKSIWFVVLGPSNPTHGVNH